ncbi:MAG: addiction module protein [Verrucomicrobiota bacterium]
MSTVLEVLDEALNLPRTEQSFLVKKLLEKMDDNYTELSEDYQTELEERIKRRESGRTQALSSEEVHANIKARIDSRTS